MLFIIAAASDAVDGRLARGKNQETKLGAVLDPIADKILVYAMLAGLCYRSIDSWLTIGFFLILMRDLLVDAMRIMIGTMRGVVVKASWPGKAKTVTQMIALSLLVGTQILGYLLGSASTVIGVVRMIGGILF